MYNDHFICFVFFSGGGFRQENIKNTNRSSSKTSIKLTLAFYNLQHVEQRRQKIKPTPHKGSFFPPFFNCLTIFEWCFKIFPSLFSFRSNSSNGKDGWPTLLGHGKLANGLSEDRKSPPLLDYLDQEVLTSDGLETELGSNQCTALSPFSSNCDSNR